MPFHKQNYFQRRTKPKGPKANERIRASQVQVIGSDGKNLGTLNTQEAINMAKQEGLDLIEISPNTNPPVCKIIDIGKYKYNLQIKANKAKKKQKIVNLKEIKIRPVIDVHDYNFKIKKVHMSPEFGPDFEDDDDIDGFPFELYQDVGDMVDYINRTVANIKL